MEDELISANDHEPRDKYEEDLQKENELGKFFLDPIYINNNIFGEDFEYERIVDLELQKKGIDLEVTMLSTGKKILIDEKAQLSYIDGALPTFAFELSSIIYGNKCDGWLFDGRKKTHKYFLITSIMTNLEGKYSYCKIHSAHREKLIKYLNDKNFSKERANKYVNDLRDVDERISDYGKKLEAFKKIDGIKSISKEYSGFKFEIEEFDKRYATLFFTNNLKEKPINLVLKLDILLKNKIAKRVF